MLVLLTSYLQFQDDGDLTRRKELELLEKEKAELGIYVSKHPIEGMWTTIAPNVTGEIVDIYRNKQRC
jgi:DNA polymerase III alpha subunit